MTWRVHPVNLGTNRRRRWLFLGLLVAVVVTCTAWTHVRKRASPPAGLTDVGEPRPRAADSLGVEGRSTKDEPAERQTLIAAALASIEECQRRYRSIRDYTCTFSKRERIKGQLTPLQVLTMKVRTQPRSIYL